MFSGNSWQGPGMPPRFFPPVAPARLSQNSQYLIHTPDKSHNILTPHPLIPTNKEAQWLTPPPAPPMIPIQRMPIFTSEGIAKGFQEEMPIRMGYLKSKTNLSKRRIIEEKDERPSTRPDTINEEEFKRLEDTIKRKLAISPEIVEKIRLEKLAMPPPLVSKEKVIIPADWNPYDCLDLTKAKYPKKVVHLANDRRYNKQTDSEYIVQTSTKLVRNPNSSANETRPVPANNGSLKWTRTEVVETRHGATEVVNLSSDSESSNSQESPEPEVVIHLIDTTFETDLSSSGSEIIIMCDKEPTTSHTPEKETKAKEQPKESTSSSSEKEQTGQSQRVVFDRSLTSFKYINGKKVTGGSKECYAHLLDKDSGCKAGFLCRFEHNGSMDHNVKICQRLLRGLCRPDAACKCEHAALLPHQYPQCVFFLRGECTLGEQCTLLHTKYSKDLPNCEDFLKGTCFNGDECDFPHSYPFHFTREYGAYDDTYDQRRNYAKRPTPIITTEKPTNDSVFQWFED